MNNLWNRSVGPFDEAAVQRHRHMGLLDCNGDVNADAVNFLAHLCAGLFFDALCDSYVEMQTSLDKGTQRKTTENELPSLTQCTA